MESAIEVLGLTKLYGSRLAVDHISFEVKPGEIFGLLGPNGAGKTTTIRMLSCLLKPTDGKAYIMGHDIRKEPRKIKGLIGVVPETSNLYDELTVWENLMFMAQLYGVPRSLRKPRVQNLLESFKLQDRSDTPFSELSRGLKRRLTIAAAFVHEPRIVFMDEPTAGLDVQSARSIRGLIQDLKTKGITVLLTTHYIEEADQLCDRIAIINHGRIVALDAPQRLKALSGGAQAIEVSFDFGSPRVPEVEEFLSMKGIQSAIRMADRIRLLVATDASEVIGQLIEYSRMRHARIVSLRTLEPSLEDAFVQLTGLAPEALRLEKDRR
jgi:ABC-2 type transport system ATP-binding protein